MGIVTVTTDFGTADGYVGEMKGVILTAAPDATLVDVAHDIQPGDVEAAAWVLWRVWERYPAGTVHVVVVDPGDRTTGFSVGFSRWAHQEVHGRSIPGDTLRARSVRRFTVAMRLRLRQHSSQLEDPRKSLERRCQPQSWSGWISPSRSGAVTAFEVGLHTSTDSGI